MDNKEIIKSMIEKSRKAQREFEAFDQLQVDRIVRAIAKVVWDNAEPLAKMAVEETGMGVYEDKVAKNKGKSRIIWHSIKDKKSVGIIGEDKEKGLIYVAKPMGVIALVTPCTNPIVTPMCNLMFALKGRNSAIIAPHPRAKKCGRVTVDLFLKELKKLGAPENLIQYIDEPSIELTQELMQQSDVVVATGGMGMVKAAYSSGHPSFGVGAGNVQVIIDRDVDFSDAADKVIRGRIFDNGIICSGEQTVIAPEDKYDEVIEAFKKHGAFYAADRATVDKFRKVIFDEKGIISKYVVGQSVQSIAKLAGVSVPEGTRVILLKASGIGREDLLCKEKMCPVMASFSYKTFEEGVKIAQANLDYEGKGHTVAVHTNNLEHVKYAGVNLTVSRLVVNQPSSLTAGGSFFNGFAPTTTLGCGSWGNNSISENLDYKHLINISRIGLFNKDAKAPTDDEIWKEI